MDERELVGLLHRADWTRLSLAGSVRGVAESVLAVFGAEESWNFGTEFPVPRSPLWTPDQLADDFALDLASGKRFRLTSADGRWAGGCDGSHVWQLIADPPQDEKVGFRARPQPPVARLLAPHWLLSGHRLTAGEPTIACGRICVQISAVPEGGSPLRRQVGAGEPCTALRWHLGGKYDRVVAVVDAALGILLRCEFQFTDRDADVTEFVRLTLDAEADPSVFSAPPGSIFGDGPVLGDFGGEMPGRFALEAVKTVAGVAAGGLGAVVRLTSPRRVDPFERATAEAADPDMVMPADEPLPVWVTGSAGTDGTGPASDEGGIPPSDEILHLLYRGGVELAPFTATLHEWTDGAALIAAVPQSARQAGFGGVGFFVDSVLHNADRGNPVMHTAHLARFGGWDRYRLDLLSRTPGTRPGRPVRDRYKEVTIACDGSRCWQVYTDRVEITAATPLHNAAGDLADGSWLLDCQLADGGEAVVDGRPGYRVIATARPGSVPPDAFSWLAGAWLPAAAVVDAATGRLLRLTRYTGGRMTRRLEFRSLSDGGPDDFGFTPPDGLRVVDRSGGASFDDSHETEFPWPDAWKWSPPDPAQAAASAVKEQVDAKIAAARGFLGSFLGGGQRGRG